MRKHSNIKQNKQIFLLSVQFFDNIAKKEMSTANQIAEQDKMYYITYGERGAILKIDLLSVSWKTYN